MLLPLVTAVCLDDSWPLHIFSSLILDEPREVEIQLPPFLRTLKFLESFFDRDFFSQLLYPNCSDRVCVVVVEQLPYSKICLQNYHVATDVTYLYFLFGGLLLSLHSETLAESKLTQFTVGFAFGFILVVAAVYLWVFRQVKRSIVPGFVSSFFSLLLVFVPSVGVLLLSQVRISSQHIYNTAVMIFFYRDPYYGFPFGWIVLVICLFISRRVAQSFEPSLVIPKRDFDEFYIDRMGRRIDEAYEVRSWPVITLSWVIYLFGLLLLLNSSAHELTSYWIVFFVLTRRVWTYLWEFVRSRVWKSKYRKISVGEYEELKSETTRFYLEKLKDEIQEFDLTKVDEVTELRLKRFLGQSLN